MRSADQIARALLETESPVRGFILATPEKYYGRLYARSASTPSSWRWQRKGVKSWIFWPVRLGRTPPYIRNKDIIEVDRQEGVVGATPRSKHYMRNLDFAAAVAEAGLEPTQVEQV